MVKLKFDRHHIAYDIFTTTCNNNDETLCIYMFCSTTRFLKELPQKYHNMIITFHNKATFHQYIIDNKLEDLVPIQYTVNDINFPAIIKPIYGTSGEHVHYLKSVDDLNRDDIVQLINDHQYVIQEFIESEYFYTAHLLFDKGNLMMGLIYGSNKTDTTQILKGAIKNYTTRAIIDYEKEQFEKMIKPSEYCGMCNVDFAYDSHNKIKVFEVNPRVGGSLYNGSKNIASFLEIMIANKIGFAE